MDDTAPIIPIYSIPDLAASAGPGIEVLALAQAFGQPRRDILAAHRHNFYEVFWITGGGGAITIDFRSYAIAPPMLCFLSPGQVHSWTFPPNATPQGHLVRFASTFFAAEGARHIQLADLPWFYAVDAPPTLAVEIAQRDHFTDLLGHLQHEYGSQLDDRETMLRAYLHILLIEAKRLAAQAGAAPAATTDYALTKRFLALVEQRYAEQGAVASYAQQLHVTASHLGEVIRRTTGRTAGAVIRERLLLEAKRLLRHSPLAVAEIAFQLGFDDPSYFGRFFRRHAGVTPGEFRRMPEKVPEQAPGCPTAR